MNRRQNRHLRTEIPSTHRPPLSPRPRLPRRSRLRPCIPMPAPSPWPPPRRRASSCERASRVPSSPSDVPRAALSPSPTTPPSVFSTSPVPRASLASSPKPGGSARVAPARTDVWWPRSIAPVAKPGPVLLAIGSWKNPIWDY